MNPKFNVGDMVWTVYSFFVPDKIPCDCCEKGKIKLKDGNLYDCPKCNLLETGYDGEDIRDPENAGWLLLETGKIDWFKSQHKVLQVNPARRLERMEHRYDIGVSSWYSESDLFSSEEEAEQEIQKQKERKNDV